MDRRIIWPSGMERDRGEEARTGENQRTLVLVSTRTSSDWTRVVSVPATHSPANGLKKWRPGSARRMKRPNFSTTATLAWSTHPQNRKKALTIFPGSSYSGGCARGGIDRSRRRLARLVLLPSRVPSSERFSARGPLLCRNTRIGNLNESGYFVFRFRDNISDVDC
jgi:hypothetical protein